MLGNNSADSKQNQLKLKFERTILSCNFSAGALFLGLSGTGELPFSSWPVGTGNTSTKPRDHLSPFWDLQVAAKVAMGTGP